MAVKPDTLGEVLRRRDFLAFKRMLDTEEGILRSLFELTADADEETRWLALEAAGPAAERAMKRDPQAVRALCDELRNRPTERGAPVKFLGAVIAAAPEELMEYIPALLNALDPAAQPERLNAALWAAGTIGPFNEAFLNLARPKIQALLEAPGEETRALAVKALNRFGGVAQPCCPGKGCC